MLVEESSYITRTDVFATFEETPSENGDRVRVGLDEIGHDFCEMNLIFEVGDPTFLIWKNGGEGVNVVVVDPSNMWVGDDNEGKVAESLNTMGKANREEG